MLLAKGPSMRLDLHIKKSRVKEIWGFGPKQITYKTFRKIYILDVKEQHQLDKEYSSFLLSFKLVPLSPVS